ncbi:serine hydrolase [Pseudoduganella sp. LjRoot289]|uniref:serine hydrolase n=1 Tax=Pseudoduganella sp. LjRoot289 TaxID=3342314 RepID=UPI003ECF71D6
MKNRTIIAAVAGVLLSGALHAAAQLDDNVRNMIAARIEKGELASVVVGIIDGKESAVYGFGVADGRAPDARTVYEIGSATKTFTALLLAQAGAAGAKLDEPVATLLPGLTIPSYAGQPITLLDLATQSSGLPRLPGNMPMRQPDNPYADYTQEKLELFLRNHQLARRPGSAYEYSNLGFGLLGQALSAQAKLPYAALVRERITAPLGMESTAVELTADMRARLAPGHSATGQPAANWDMGALAGAGALRSDAQDLILYLKAHMQAGAGSPYARVRQAQRPAPGPDMRIGLAWHLNPVRGRPVVWHNGATGGYSSFLGFTADGQRGVVVLASTATAIDSIALASLVPGAAVEPQAIAMTAEALAGYAGRYQLAPNFILTVKPAATGLQVQASGQPAFIAGASAPDEFFLTVVDARLSFKRSKDGAVDRLVLHQNGRAMPADKID